MAEFASLPLFTDAINSDCGHLSNEEFGLYMRLLILMWRTPECRVPDENAWIARKLRMTVDDCVAKIRPLINEFCICYADALHDRWISQKRLQKEFAHVRTSVAKRKAAAAKRWEIENAKKNDEHSISIADAPTPTPTPTPSIKETPPPSVLGAAENLKPDKQPKERKRAAKLPDDFEPDLQPAIEDGMQPQEAIMSLARFKDHALANGRTQIDWLASWRLWYRGDIEKNKRGRSSRSQAPPEPRLHPVVEEIQRRREARNANGEYTRTIDHEN